MAWHHALPRTLLVCFMLTQNRENLGTHRPQYNTLGAHGTSDYLTLRRSCRKTLRAGAWLHPPKRTPTCQGHWWHLQLRWAQMPWRSTPLSLWGFGAHLRGKRVQHTGLDQSPYFSFRTEKNQEAGSSTAGAGQGQGSHSLGAVVLCLDRSLASCAGSR